MTDSAFIISQNKYQVKNLRICGKKSIMVAKVMSKINPEELVRTSGFG